MTRLALIFAAIPLMLALALLSGGCSKAVREKALKEHSLSMCDSVPHESGASCAAEVSRRFPRCSPELLEHRVTAETYARCLGFVLGAGGTGTSPAK